MKKEKKIVENTLEQFNKRIIQWKDIKHIEFEDDDEFYFEEDDDGWVLLLIIRKELETDEQYQKRLKQENKTNELKIIDKELNYLTAKKEFDRLTEQEEFRILQLKELRSLTLLL